ncbi:MAG: hypothetical protein ABSG53_07960, partial [Thermoguttaceae bacterium]
MTTIDALADVLRAALVDPEAAGAVRKLMKHPGGRPKGSRNRGYCLHCGHKARADGAEAWEAKRNECQCQEPLAIVTKLDKAVLALNRRRSRMTAEEIEESEWRVNRFLTMSWPWKNKAFRKALVKHGVLKQEMRVVVAYRWSEDRVGVSRTRRFIGNRSTIGAGYDPLEEDEPTLKETLGLAKRSGPKRQKRSVGYPTAHEEIVEESIEDDPILLWGQDVTNAIKEEEDGYEPIRGRRSGRRWLAPVVETEDYTVGKRTLPGAGDGSNGKAPTWDWEPTIGECHQALMEADPVLGGLPYEPDGRGVHVVMEPAQFRPRRCRINKIVPIGFLPVEIDVCCIVPKMVDIKWVNVVADPYRAPENGFIELPFKRPLGGKDDRYYGVPRVYGPMARSEGESGTGLYET